jgi:hypothetical protein
MVDLFLDLVAQRSSRRHEPEILAPGRAKHAGTRFKTGKYRACSGIIQKKA